MYYAQKVSTLARIGCSMMRVVLYICVVFLCISSNTILCFGKEVVVAVDKNFAPFSYVDAQGAVSGFDVDLLQKIFENNTYALQFKPLPWEEIQAALSGGYVTMATNFIQRETTKELFLFSAMPYYKAHFSIFSKKNHNTVPFSMLRGKAIGVKKHSFAEQILLQYNDMQLQQFENDMEGLRALSDGTVPFYFGLDNVVQWNLKKGVFAGIFKNGAPLYVRPVYFAFNKSNKDVVDFVNARLIKLVRDGTYHRIYGKWFSYAVSAKQQEALIQAAQSIATRSIIRSTKEHIGAAVLSVQGNIYTGITYEYTKNIGIDSVLSAVAEAIKAEDNNISAVVVCNAQGKLMHPSIRALQLLASFNESILVIMQDAKGKRVSRTVGEVLSVSGYKRSI